MVLFIDESLLKYAHTENLMCLMY